MGDRGKMQSPVSMHTMQSPVSMQNMKRRSFSLARQRSSTPASDRLSTHSASSTLVAIRVEPNGMPFAVRKSLLRDQSPWFADMLQKHPDELQFEHVPKRTFRLFVAWLYAGRLVHPEIALRDPSGDNDKEDDTHDEVTAWHDVDLVSLYAFGQHYQVRRLRNDVITTIYREHERTGRITSEAAIRFHWEVSGSDNHMSRFVLQERALYGMTDRGDIPAYFKTLPSSFLASVVRAAASLNGERSRGHPIGELPSACLWHDHGGDFKEKTVCRQRLIKTTPASRPQSMATGKPKPLQAGPRLRGECRSRPSGTWRTSEIRPNTAGNRLSTASTAVMHNDWKLDSDVFHPLFIPPEYPVSAPLECSISPPPYALKEHHTSFALDDRRSSYALKETPPFALDGRRSSYALKEKTAPYGALDGRRSSYALKEKTAPYGAPNGPRPSIRCVTCP